MENSLSKSRGELIVAKPASASKPKTKTPRTAYEVAAWLAAAMIYFVYAKAILMWFAPIGLIIAFFWIMGWPTARWFAKASWVPPMEYRPPAWREAGDTVCDVYFVQDEIRVEKEAYDWYAEFRPPEALGVTDLQLFAGIPEYHLPDSAYVDLDEQEESKVVNWVRRGLQVSRIIKTPPAETGSESNTPSLQLVPKARRSLASMCTIKP